MFFCFSPRWRKGVVHDYGHVCFLFLSLAWRKCYTWAHAWPLLLPITFVYYSPGDKAQKVIPGGAKTNESL